MRGILCHGSVILSVFGMVAVPERVEAQVRAEPPPVSAIGDTVTVIPGADYHAGGLARLFLGSGWRDLWLMPVDAPVFDLGSYAGGLKPVQLGGGFQTITLHLVEAEGWREYRFRSVNKFPEQQAMPAAIRGTPAGALIQDQASTLFPAASLLVPPLLAAIDAPHVPAELYIMPDDPRLEEHQRTFAGMLGTVELKPDNAPDDEPGFAGARVIKGTENFFDDIEASRTHRLDEREYLAVRLIDFLINDSDRTPDNFEWARFSRADSTFRWRPIPRDRDRAFMDARGWLNSLVMRRFYPKLVEWKPAYSLEGLTHTSFTLDRRLLQRLTRADFEEVALYVQQAIDDSVIEAVIARLPPRWHEQTTAAERLRHVLTARRAGLSAIALEFYDDLAGEVDVYGTSDDEHVDVVRYEDGRITVTIDGRDDQVEVVRHDDGSVTLALNGSTDSALAMAAPFYRRTFLPAETNEIRLYLEGGNDLAIVRGAPSRAIIVRVMGGAGDDVLVDSAGGGGTYFYDPDGDDRFVTASGTRVSLEPWIAPDPAFGLRLGKAWRPDWGGSSGWSGTIDYGEGNGLIIGFGPQRTRYGFRRLPHHSSARASLLVGLGSGRLGVAAGTEYRAENSPLALTLAVSASQLDALRFYGYGNNTPKAKHDLTLVQQSAVMIEPALVWHIGWRSREGLADPLRGENQSMPGLRPLVGRLDAGPLLYWSNPEPRPGSPLELTGAPGGEAFGRAGFRLGIELDRTDQDPVPTRGWKFDAELAAYPPVWDVAEAFSTADVVGSAYLPLPGNGPHLALRAGAALASGLSPVQHAPAIGGRTTVRGYPWQRYTGDAAAHGSAELRVPTGSMPLFVRWQTGVFGLVDAGRVWFDGQSDGGWHTGLGGGFWLSALGKGVSLAYAHGQEHRLYLESGVSF